MRWKTSAKLGRFDAAAGSFTAEVIELKDGAFSWAVYIGGTSGAQVVLASGETALADDARRYAGNAIFNHCIEALKGLHEG